MVAICIKMRFSTFLYIWQPFWICEATNQASVKPLDRFNGPQSDCRVECLFCYIGHPIVKVCAGSLNVSSTYHELEFSQVQQLVLR